MSCARRSPATWAGSSAATARSMRRSTAGTSSSRRCAPRSSPTSSSNFDAEARALLDRRARRRECRLGLPGARTPTRSRELRLLLVEPKARGLGIGARLVDECVRFARERGYRSDHAMDPQRAHAARHIYEQNGLQAGRQQQHDEFGQELIGETWELGAVTARRLVGWAIRRALARRAHAPSRSFSEGACRVPDIAAPIRKHQPT